MIEGFNLAKHNPKSLPIHGMALTSTGRKIEHNKVVVGAKGIGIRIPIERETADTIEYQIVGFSHRALV